MSTQLQAIGNFSKDEVEVMQQTLAVGTTVPQFNLFVRTAAAAGLNPFLNHIYCIVYNGKMSIQVSVEGIVYLAKRVEGYEGIDTQLVHEHDEFEAYIDEDGKWVIGTHRIKFPRGKVLACYSIAYRTGFKPFTVFIEADEVQHHLSGTNAGNWKKYYNDFFKKTATKRAAKGQFGIEIAEDDEGNSSTDLAPYERKTIDPADVTIIPTEPEAKQKGKGKADPAPAAPIDEAVERKALNKEIRTKYVVLGKTKDDEISAHMAANMTVAAGEKPTIEQLKELMNVIDSEIAAKNDDLPE